MQIPGADLRAQHAALREDLQAAMTRVLDSGSYVLGEEVAAFEREFAAYCGSKHCVGVANGTDALVLALRIFRLKPDDYVAVPAFTFAATAEAVCLAGARPLFVDVDPTTLNLDPAALRATIAHIPGRLRAVIAVHLYGQPAAMAEINDLAAAQGACVVEDAAQAHGARSQGRRAGGLGRLGCFSFYPTKNLGALGDAGAITTDDDGLVERLRMLRDHGQFGKYVHQIVGLNSRLDALQAALLRVKLPHLDAWNTRRRAIAAIYNRELAGLPLTLPSAAPDVEHVFHLFVARTRERDGLVEHLNRRGIASSVHYPKALPEQHAFAYLGHQPGEFPHAEAAAREVFTLPCYPELSDAAVVEICQVVREWISTR